MFLAITSRALMMKPVSIHRNWKWFDTFWWFSYSSHSNDVFLFLIFLEGSAVWQSEEVVLQVWFLPFLISSYAYGEKLGWRCFLGRLLEEFVSIGSKHRQRCGVGEVSSWRRWPMPSVSQLQSETRQYLYAHCSKSMVRIEEQRRKPKRELVYMKNC